MNTGKTPMVGFHLNASALVEEGTPSEHWKVSNGCFPLEGIGTVNSGHGKLGDGRGDSK